VWVAEGNKVFRVDPKTLRIEHTIDVPQADLLAFGDGSLWVGQSNTSSISEIDPAVNEVVRTVKLRGFIGSLTVGGGFVWATVDPDDTLWKIDENGTVEKSFDVSGALAYFDGAVWIGSAGQLQRLDPSSERITAYPVVEQPQDLEPGNGVLYVSTGESPPKLTALPADEVASFSLAEDWLDDTDPAHAYPSPPYRMQFEYATGAQLLNYPDAPAPRGKRLEPEVAAAMPSLSRDGRTYTFHVRSGYRFSPPSNEEVTAETFKASIERALSPGFGDDAPGYYVLTDVVGAKAFHEGKAPDISGIRADGDVLRIRLVAPAGDFATRLSLPFFAAVPIGTPVVNGGLQTPIPSAGPYYMKVRWQDSLVVLERNPNYHGPRPHRLARIVYDINNTTRRTVSRIESGEADYTADVLSESTFAAGGPLDRRFGRGASPRLVQTPQLAFRFLVFNTERGPFVDARLRRAVNYALNRPALAALEHELPSAAYLPPGLAGGGAAAYPLKPALGKARALAKGFHGKVVLYACGGASCTAAARVVRASLAPIGMSVAIKQFDDQYAESQKPGARYDMVLLGWSYDWPDPYMILNGFLDPNGFRFAFGPKPISIPAKYRKELERVALLRGDARAAAYRKLSVKLAREVAPFAVFSTAVLPEFFSARVGCRVTQPIVGAVDIGTLCIRKH
jgi:ABC-type transport system substrate-binding protein